MNVKPMKSETDYKFALKRMKEIFDEPVGTSEGTTDHSSQRCGNFTNTYNSL